jgi:hypothetical protein
VERSLHNILKKNAQFLCGRQVEFVDLDDSSGFDMDTERAIVIPALSDVQTRNRFFDIRNLFKTSYVGSIKLVAGPA